MALNSRIEWTDNSVPVVAGCDYAGAGCKNCYAPRQAWRLAHHPNPKVSSRYAGTVEKRDGKLLWTGRVNLDLDQLTAIQEARRPQTWFLSQVGDLFHEQVPAAVIDAVLAVAAMKPEQRLILLTKRYDRMADLLTGPRPLPNLWVGMSVAYDRDAAAAATHLRKLDAQGWPTLVSYEPAVGPVDWAAHGFTFLRWIISGGESGSDARPTHPNWHRATRDFCTAHGIAYFFKQWGEWGPILKWEVWRRLPMTAITHDGGSIDMHTVPENVGAHRMIRVGKKAAGRSLDGRIWDEVPA